MSCIRFNTEAQRNQFSFADCEADPVSAFLSPQVTDGKLLRLHSMATSSNSKIREAAAASPHLPEKTFWLLSKDESDSVREYVARNPFTPSEVLESLLSDSNSFVVCHTIVNPSTPYEAILGLQRIDAQVERFVRWRTEQGK